MCTRVEPISEVIDEELLDEDVRHNDDDEVSDVHGNDDANDDEAWHDVLSAQQQSDEGAHLGSNGERRDNPSDDDGEVDDAEAWGTRSNPNMNRRSKRPQQDPKDLLLTWPSPVKSLR